MGIWFLLKEECTLQKCVCLKNWASSFVHCVFHHLRHDQKTSGPQHPFTGFGEAKMGPSKPFEDTGSPFCAGWCVACVSGVACVCGVPWSVKKRVNDVFLRCVLERHDAVCHFCATRLHSSVIFLMLMPWGAIFSMGKSSSADKTTLEVRVLVYTLGLRQNDAVVHGFGVVRSQQHLTNQAYSSHHIPEKHPRLLR